MLITPHATAGAAIAAVFPNPLIALPASLAIHFVLDTIPHWQEVINPPYRPTKTTYFRLPIDISLAITLVWLISKTHPATSPLIWSSALVSNLPDLDVVATNFFPRLLRQGSIFKKYYDWHCRIQKETKNVVGIFTQILVVLLATAVTLSH